MKDAPSMISGGQPEASGSNSQPHPTTKYCKSCRSNKPAESFEQPDKRVMKSCTFCREKARRISKSRSTRKKRKRQKTGPRPEPAANAIAGLPTSPILSRLDVLANVSLQLATEPSSAVAATPQNPGPAAPITTPSDLSHPAPGPAPLDPTAPTTPANATPDYAASRSATPNRAAFSPATLDHAAFSLATPAHAAFNSATPDLDVWSPATLDHADFSRATPDHADLVSPSAADITRNEGDASSTGLASLSYLLDLAAQSLPEEHLALLNENIVGYWDIQPAGMVEMMRGYIAAATRVRDLQVARST